MRLRTAPPRDEGASGYTISGAFLMATRHTCSPCSGDGYYGSNPKDTCKVCSGRGYVELEGDATDYTKCRTCGGDGYFGFDHRDTCTECGGVGLLSRHKTK